MTCPRRAPRPSRADFPSRAWAPRSPARCCPTARRHWHPWCHDRRPGVHPDPVALGQVAQSLLDVLPAKAHTTPEYAYLRQTVRTNNAAVVAEGAVKPTSVYTVVRIEDSLVVIAHLSEGDPALLAAGQLRAGDVRRQRAAVRPADRRGGQGARRVNATSGIHRRQSVRPLVGAPARCARRQSYWLTTARGVEGRDARGRYSRPATQAG